MTQTLWPDPRTKKNQGCRRSWRCLLFGWEFLSSAWHVWDSRCQADLRRNLEVARKHRIAGEKLQALHKIKGCEMTLQAHCKELANCVSNSHELNLKMCVGAFVAPIQAQLNKAKVQEHAADSTEALFWISFACWFPWAGMVNRKFETSKCFLYCIPLWRFGYQFLYPFSSLALSSWAFWCWLDPIISGFSWSPGSFPNTANQVKRMKLLLEGVARQKVEEPMMKIQHPTNVGRTYEQQ